MVVYEGGGKHPQEQNIWALVEVKKGYIDADFLPDRRSDRQKLLFVDALFSGRHPHLICCGSFNDDGRTIHENRAKEQNDGWYEAEAGNLLYGYGKMYFCARVINGLRPRCATFDQ